MTAYVARRLAQAIPTLLVASIVVFAIVHLIPGDPAVILAGPDASPAVVEAVRGRLGLDEPLWAQYLTWVGNVLQGDLGTSYLSQVPTWELISRRLPASLQLAVAALVLASVGGLVAGVVAAINANRPVDRLIVSTSALGIATPAFWFGILLILAFSLYLGVLPPGGRVPWDVGVGAALGSLALPAATLSMNAWAILTRFTRSAMLETLQDDYVRTARAKGVSRGKIVRKHALRNGLIPVLTVLGILFGRMIGSAVVVESVFTWPGLGRLLVESINNRDYAVVQGVILLLVVAFLIINTIVDLLYGVLDPRVRLDASR